MTNATIFIFGGTGDLSKKKLLPSLYHLYKDNRLSSCSPIIALGRSDLTKEEFLQKVRFETYIDNADSNVLDEFKELINYQQIDFNNDDQAYLKKDYEKIRRSYTCGENKIFYLSLPASRFADVTKILKQSKLLDGNGFNRVAFEKPFGYDTKSATKLNNVVTSVFEEDDVFRIDHYLGKDLIQNLSVLKFANPIFHEVWNKEYVEKIEIIFSEHIGIEQRAEYYDESGALRDVMQNHILQVLGLLCMKLPKSYTGDEINNAKYDVIKDLALPNKEDIILGQYKEGVVHDKEVKGYLDEDGVKKDSKTETYACIKTYVQNNQWKGVPIYLTTGKRLKNTHSEIKITLKKTKHNLFEEEKNNVLTITMKPKQGIDLVFNGRKPQHDFEITRFTFNLQQQNMYEGNTPKAYEVVFDNILRNNKDLFIPWNIIEKSWEFIDYVYDTVDDGNYCFYPAGFTSNQIISKHHD